jgi:hypothetical protein
MVAFELPNIFRSESRDAAGRLYGGGHSGQGDRVRRGPVVVVVALFALATASPGMAETRQPSFEEAVSRSTVVVLGRVERLENRNGRPVATVRVDHLVKGTSPTIVTFFADPIGDFQPSATIGKSLVAFLEPSGQDAPPLQVSFNGAGCLTAFSRNGAYYVAMSKFGGVQFSREACEPDVRLGLNSCAARLDRVLKSAKLPAPPKVPIGAATYRVRTRECPGCEFADWVARRTKPGAVDCGRTSEGPATAAEVDCVRSSLAKKQPFTVVIVVQGIDSDIAMAYLSDGSSFEQLSFDSSVEGGGTCAALVSATACESIEVRSKQRVWLRCANPGAQKTLCSQSETRVEALTAPEDVSKLACNVEMTGGSFQCPTNPTDPGKMSHPPRSGPNLLCHRWTTYLQCDPE